MARALLNERGMNVVARRVQISLCTALALVVVAGAAHADAPKLAALTKAYADKHGLPVRIVKSDLGTRQVERHFVPVLPTTHDDFLATFQEENGAVVWKAKPNDPVHGVVHIRPGDMISYGARHGDTLNVLPHASGGNYITLAVNKQQLASWNAFIDKYTPAGSVPFAFGNNDGLKFFTQAMQAGGTPVYGGCLWWVVHGELEGVNLAHLMGVRRAKGPEVLAPRLIHAGNELVGPIGIPVATIEQFNAMTDQQLLGPEPAGGAAEQVKQSRDARATPLDGELDEDQDEREHRDHADRAHHPTLKHELWFAGANELRDELVA